MIATWDYDDVWAWTAARAYVWVHGPVAAGVCLGASDTTQGR